MRTGTLLGIRFRVHPVWLLIFALIILSIVTSIGGADATPLAGPAALAIGTIVVMLVAGSIVLHGATQALVARRMGLPQGPVRVLVLGTPTEPEPEPVSPSSELVVAGTGPLVNAALGSMLMILARLIGADHAEPTSYLYWASWWLGAANLTLALFYLVPVLPLDGGRLVRAVSWLIFRDLDRATRVTSLVGKAFGFMVIGGGLLIAMTADIVIGIWLVLLGWFTTRLSRAAVDRRRMERLAAGLEVRDATDTKPSTVLPSISVEALLEQDEQATGPGVYPVVDEDRLLGVVFSARLRGLLRRRAGQRARDVLVPIDRAPSVKPGDPLIRAVDQLEAMRLDGLPVVDPADPGRLYGVVTRARVLDRLRVRHRMAAAREGSASASVRG